MTNMTKLNSCEILDAKTINNNNLDNQFFPAAFKTGDFLNKNDSTIL